MIGVFDGALGIASLEAINLLLIEDPKLWWIREGSGQFTTRCIDEGCSRQFQGQGTCVEFSSADIKFEDLPDKYDFRAGSVKGVCGHKVSGKEDCCHCLKLRPEHNATTEGTTTTAGTTTEQSPTCARVITIGGLTGRGSTNSVEELGHSQTSISDLPSSRNSHTATVLPGTQDILVCGGQGVHDTSMRSCMTYSQNTWKDHSTLR